MRPTDQLTEILPTVTRLVERIRPMQLNDPTPCTEFTVHDVLDHMVVLGGSFAARVRPGAGVGVPQGDGRSVGRRAVAGSDGPDDLGADRGAAG